MTASARVAEMIGYPLQRARQGHGEGAGTGRRHCSSDCSTLTACSMDFRLATASLRLVVQRLLVFDRSCRKQPFQLRLSHGAGLTLRREWWRWPVTISMSRMETEPELPMRENRRAPHAIHHGTKASANAALSALRRRMPSSSTSGKTASIHSSSQRVRADRQSPRQNAVNPSVQGDSAGKVGE